MTHDRIRLLASSPMQIHTWRLLTFPRRASQLPCDVGPKPGHSPPVTGCGRRVLSTMETGKELIILAKEQLMNNKPRERRTLFLIEVHCHFTLMFKMRKESSLLCANFLPTALVALGVPTRVPVGTAHLTTVYAAARSDRETKALPSYSYCFSLSYPHFCPFPPTPPQPPSPCSSLRGNVTKLFLQEKTTSSPGTWVFILKSAVNLAEPHKDNAKTVWAQEWVERSRGAWGWLGRSSTGAEAQDPQESLEVLQNHAFYVNAYCSRPCLSPGEAICGKNQARVCFEFLPQNCVTPPS